MARILVIEDNPVNMKLAALLLHNAGHTVLRAVDAETGLALARADLPDLVLMDFQLPGMDGSAATTLLKQDPATATIPVIALTAMPMKSAREKGLLVGCEAYVAKPLHYQELYAAIDTLLAKEEQQAGAGLPEAASSLPTHDASVQTAVARTVDVSILAGLVGNDPTVILEFLDDFRVSAAKIARDLTTACLDRQASQAGKQAHKLKSSAHTVGATTLGGLCTEMETAGKAGRTETLLALLPRFERELEAVNACLDALLAPPASTVTTHNAKERCDAG